MKAGRPFFKAIVCLTLYGQLQFATSMPLSGTIERVKPAVVGIGSYQKTRSPAVVFIGTGFVVGNGLTIVTAAHVVQKLIQDNETIGILIAQGGVAQFRSAVAVTLDNEHDLARLKVTGSALPTLSLGDSSAVSEGSAMAFTGFPLGIALGLHPVTHRATVSAITPVIMPALSASKLDVAAVAQLHKTPFDVFQLDGTAYPGSSGSPLYDVETGEVYGIVNMVYVKGLKETAISTPSGISYAIPANFVGDLLRRP
jgi:S1-C subfamily serine protease